MRIHSYGGLKTSGEELMGMELGTSSRLVAATVLIGVLWDSTELIRIFGDRR